MAGSRGGRGGRSGGGHKPRSVGAAAGVGHPNGAILDDGEEQIRRKLNFREWADKRKTKLTENAWTKMYRSSKP